MGAKTIREGNIVELAYEAIFLIRHNNRSNDQIGRLIRELHKFVNEPAKNATNFIPASAQMTEQQKLEGNLFLLIAEAMKLSLGKTPRRTKEQIIELIKALQAFKDAPSIGKLNGLQLMALDVNFNCSDQRN